MICDRCKTEITVVAPATDGCYIRESSGVGWWDVVYPDGSYTPCPSRGAAEICLKNYIAQCAQQQPEKP